MHQPIQRHPKAEESHLEENTLLAKKHKAGVVVKSPSRNQNLILSTTRTNLTTYLE